jgi:uncharacterized repeat protein (TIGR02543 family)
MKVQKRVVIIAVCIMVAAAFLLAAMVSGCILATADLSGIDEKPSDKGPANAAAPVITAQPQGAAYNQNDPAAALTVTAEASDGGTLSYQWYNNAIGPITGKTEARYIPPTTAIGTGYYFVVVTNSAGTGTKTAFVISDLAAIEVIFSVLAGAVSITGGSGAEGAPQPGDTLTANNGIINGEGTLAFQWKRDGSPIGTNAAAYTVVTDDVGYALTVTLTYDNGSKTSAPTAEVVHTALAGSVSITGGSGPEGAPLTGDTLTADISGITNGEGTPAFQWKQDGITVIGTNAAAYTVAAADVGHTLTVTLTYDNGSVTSAPTAAVVSTGGDTFVPVTNITGVPTGATAGTDLSLSGTVVPGNATNQTITWSVASAGATGASIVSGTTLRTTAAGTATITATVINGLTASSNYTQNFDITVTAPAPADTVTITFNSMGGSTVASQTVNYGDTVAEPTNPAKTGYTFVNWYDAESGGNAIAWPLAIMENRTVYARWSAVSYTVTYTGGSGSTGSTSSSTHYYDQSKALSANGFSKTGYTLAGWATSADGPVVYGPGASVLNLIATDGATVPLYAVWTINTYLITFKDGDGATLQSGYWSYNATPSYSGATPTKTASADYTYTWNNTWSPAIVAVTADAVYTAQFTQEAITVAGTWLGGDWGTGWSGWTDDPVVADPADPAAAYPPAVSTAATWLEVADADITAGDILTIAVNGTAGTFTISNYIVGGPHAAALAGSHSLTTEGLRFSAVSGNRRVLVDAASGVNAIPLNMQLAGVNISAQGNPLALANNASVLLNIVSTSVLTAAGPNRQPAGIRVPPGTKIEITSSTGASLTSQNTYTADIDNGGSGIGGNFNESAGTVIINGDVAVIAKPSPSLYPSGASIGGGNRSSGGTIIIGGNARITATGGYGGPGIGGGTGGTIAIGGNARVTATGGYNASGIGGSLDGFGGGTIAIGGNAQVTATGGNYGPGIGAGSLSNSTPENTIITITGSAKVYAQGGKDSAGIGGGDGDSGYTTGAKITIGTGSDYPLVIAKSAASTESNGYNTSAIGAGGVASPAGSVVQIEIKSGFVVAKRMHDNAAGQDIGGASGSGSYVRITGGSVYAANAAISPAPQNASSQPVYPLYTPGTLGGYKTVSVTSPGYTAITIGKSAARFLATGLFTPSGADQFPATAVDVSTLLFPAAISATLWLPAANYAGITTSPASGTYGATVTASLAGYTDGGAANRLLLQ